MPVRVAEGVTETIADHADGFVLHVTEASDVDAALRALARVRNDLPDLARRAGGTPAEMVVSNPVLAPRGPMLRIARIGLDDDALGSIPELVTARLEEHGVTSAVVRAPAPGGSLDRLDDCANAVVLRLFPEPAGEDGALPVEWIDIACEWVLGDLAPSDTVPIRLLGVGFDVRVADAPAILHQAAQAHAWCDVVNGDLEDRLRTASITFGRAPHVALAAGGPACDSNALMARFELLAEAARDLASEVAYACVDIEETFEGVGLGLSPAGWRAQGGASPNLVAGELVDVLVPDAFPYQILGKGHLARLGEHDPGAEDSLGAPLANGRVEVRIGNPADWLPLFDARDDVQARGWDLLAPLLASEAEAEDMLRARPARQVEESLLPDAPTGPLLETAPAAQAAGGGTAAAMPDLDDITLETLPHSRRGLRLTFLELVSWLAHEPHSDAPASTSPVVATYARWFASAVDDVRRQELKARARSLIGTGRSPAPTRPTGAPALTDDDVARAWLAADWLARVQAPAWLRLVGLNEAAEQLERIGPAADRQSLMKAVDVLGSVIGIVGRRLEVTASIAGTDRPGDVELVEAAAWEAWEQASEASGWVAASEAASVGIPAELAYATDLRVIECARDARARDALDAAHRTIGDAAWTAALHAMADQAWTAAWDAAHPAVDGLAVLPLRTALDRAKRAATASAGLDEDDHEESLEEAEQAAKELLTRAALGPPAWVSDEHPWDAARAAAAASPHGELWARVQHLARAAVDEGPWDAGMAAARAAVEEVLHEAPDLVARAVGAAMAREAAGTAARCVALRAAAVSRAQGGSADDAHEAAADALARTVGDLQQSAFRLLDALVAVRSAPGA